MSIEAIFDELKARNVSFDDCRIEVRTQVLRNLKKRNVESVIPNLSFISTDLACATFLKDDLVSGNVDGRLVRDLAQVYGFALPKVRSDELLTVKTIRNDLAHGLKTFSEVGREFDVERLEKIMREVIGFLRALLANITAYIKTQSYLSTRSS